MSRLKRLPSMSLVVALGATVAGCDDPGAQVAQRDVYTGPNAFENCVADWGNEELCRQRLDDAERRAYAQHSGGSSGGSTIMIWGPGYYGDRSVVHGGQTYTPATTRAVNTAQFNSNFKPTSFSAPKPAFTGVVSRGGFGATGRSFGGGSFGG